MKSEIGNQFDVVNIRALTCAAYIGLGDLETATRIAHETLERSQELDHHFALIDANEILCEIAWLGRRYQESAQYLAEARKLRGQYSYQFALASTQATRMRIEESLKAELGTEFQQVVALPDA